MQQDAFRHEPPDSETSFRKPGSLWGEIEEALGKLAGLASANGAHTLATTITIAALEASRTQDKLGRPKVTF